MKPTYAVPLVSILAEALEKMKNECHAEAGELTINEDSTVVEWRIGADRFTMSVRRDAGFYLGERKV